MLHLSQSSESFSCLGNVIFHEYFLTWLGQLHVLRKSDQLIAIAMFQIAYALADFFFKCKSNIEAENRYYWPKQMNVNTDKSFETTSTCKTHVPFTQRVKHFNLSAYLLTCFYFPFVVETF